MAAAPKELKRAMPYVWEDHDPVLDQMKTIRQDEGLSLSETSLLTGLSKTTLDKWENRSRKGKRKPTMKPMFDSVMRFTRGLGYDLRFVKPERKISPTKGVILQRNIRAKSDLNQVRH
jgi:transcriptional regulator with XRE-family HTH domain